jgi:hypothetical protein
MDAFQLVSQTILTQEQLAAIGCVAIESTYCEIVVEQIIWQLSGLDEEHGKHFTQNVQLNSRLELLSTLGKMHIEDEAHKAEFVKLISDLKIANTDRNTVIHGSWTSSVRNFLVLWRDGADKHPPANASKRRLNNEPITTSADKVIEVAKRIATLKSQLLDLAERRWPDAWLSRPLPPLEGR